MDTDKNTLPSWWEENGVIGEMIVFSIGTTWLSLEVLSYGATVIGAWQSCTTGNGADCTPWKAVGLVVVALVGVVFLSYRQPMLMRFVGATFFGLFLAGFCGIIGFFESVYPWWVHATLVIVGIFGAAVLLPEELEEILEGRIEESVLSG